jgi:hypothetical protein
LVTEAADPPTPEKSSITFKHALDYARVAVALMRTKIHHFQTDKR